MMTTQSLYASVMGQALDKIDGIHPIWQVVYTSWFARWFYGRTVLLTIQGEPRSYQDAANIAIRYQIYTASWAQTEIIPYHPDPHNPFIDKLH